MKQQRTHARTGWKLAGALVCCAWLAAPVQAQARQPAQVGQPAQSQARPAAQAGPAAASEQAAATRQQARKTDQANRAAAVADETSAAAAQAARTAQSEAAQYEAAQGRNEAGGGATPPSYGPVLAPPGRQAADPARKDPAEVHDETDTRTRQAPPQEPQASRQAAPPAQPRRPAAQAMTEPMAPRPLRSSVDPAGGATAASTAGATAAVPAPAPVMPPRPVTPTSRVIGSCQGASCLDTKGNRYNGIGEGGAGVNSSGRLCTRTGVTVQCF